MRRRIIIVAAWAVAVAAVGIGVTVALPGGDSVGTVALTGAAVITRPEGSTLVQGSWGSGQGQFGYGEEPREGPNKLVSPDGQLIAILDWANSRVALCERSSKQSGTIPLPDKVGLFDLGLDGQGTAYVLKRGPETKVLAFAKGSTEAQTHPVASGIEPQFLVINGNDVWVWSEGDLSYPVILGGSPVSVAEQTGRMEHGWPSGDEFLQGARTDTHNATLSVTGPSPARKSFSITSTDLPIDSVYPLGKDSSGNYYVAMRIYAEDWQGTESWCFVGISPQGQKLGQVRLPFDYWAGGGFKLAPDGTILEMRSSEQGLVVTVHQLGCEQ